MGKEYRYFVLFKPWGYLSQFTREEPHHRTLADLYDFPRDVYPIGRLDMDSEGLLLLTNDKALNHRLLDPAHGHRRTYLAQVEGRPTEAALEALRNGVEIRINKKVHRTRPAQVDWLAEAPALPPREKPVHPRPGREVHWLRLTLTEGKNRQVRRMCARVGLPVLRLVRVAIERLELGDMQPGEVREWKSADLYPLLFGKEGAGK